jgi:hypothetical protein
MSAACGGLSLIRWNHFGNFNHGHFSNNTVSATAANLVAALLYCLLLLMMSRHRL